MGVGSPRSLLSDCTEIGCGDPLHEDVTPSKVCRIVIDKRRGLPKSANIVYKSISQDAQMLGIGAATWTTSAAELLGVLDLIKHRPSNQHRHRRYYHDLHTRATASLRECVRGSAALKPRFTV